MRGTCGQRDSFERNGLGVGLTGSSGRRTLIPQGARSGLGARCTCGGQSSSPGSVWDEGGRQACISLTTREPLRAEVPVPGADPWSNWPRSLVLSAWICINCGCADLSVFIALPCDHCWLTAAFLADCGLCVPAPRKEWSWGSISGWQRACIVIQQLRPSRPLVCPPRKDTRGLRPPGCPVESQRAAGECH